MAKSSKSPPSREEMLPQIAWEEGTFEKKNRPSLRNSHAVATDPENNCVYIFGGRSKGGSNNHLLVMDLKSKEDGWTLLETTGSVPKPRKSAGMAYHQGNLYLFGGNSQKTLNDFYRYSIVNNEWTQLIGRSVKSPTVRDRHTLTCIGDNLYLFGGHSETEDFMNDLWIYSINRNEWTHFDPKLNGSESINGSLPALPIARYEHCACAYQGLLVIIGGKSRQGGLSDIITFDVKRKEWLTPDIQDRKREPCWGQSVVHFHDKLLLFGGWNGRSCFNDLQLLYVDKKPWKWGAFKLVGMRPSIRTFHASAVANHYMIVVAGRNMGRRLNDTFFLDLRELGPGGTRTRVSLGNIQELAVDQMPQNKSQLHKDSKIKKVTLDHFELRTTLGTGSFGRVRLVRYKKSGEFFALKMLRKTRVVEMKQENHIKWEKKILSSIRHPFIVNMEASFQSKIYLFLVLELVPGGEFFTLLRKTGTLRMPHCVFYTAQIVLVFQFLHKNNIVYRDLKPENLLIGPDGYLRLTDFGFAKRLEKPYRTWTLCGTPEYIAPEILLNRGHSYSVDWWALGILIFEMFTGNPPFVDDNPMKIYQKILDGRIKWPSPKKMHQRARDFISKLLTKNIAQRMGSADNGAVDVMKHLMFDGVDWRRILDKKVKAPYIPQLSSVDDTKHFDPYDEDTDTEDQPLEEDPFIKDF